jgi:nucleotide-binding universal stress UspA family protein
MYRILVPVDGSEAALRALGYAMRLERLISQSQIDLVNVQPPISGSVGAFVGNQSIAEFHQDESENALAAARELLESEGVPVHSAMRIGSAGQAIVDYAQELACDQIVMGTRGLGRVGSLVLGSVATQVVQLAQVPVTLVK